MSIFEQKYEENLKAGDKLLQDGLYNACIHCYYYACYQLLLHIIDTQNIGKPTNEKSHDETIRHVCSKITNAGLSAFCLGLLFTLKDRRIIADYHKISISKKAANDSQSIAKNLILSLKNTFSI